MARCLIHYCLCIIYLVLSIGAYAGKINLALYRKVIHSSSFDHHTTGHMTVDGSLASFWESNSASRQWLLLDLGRKTPVEAVIIHWGQPFSGKISISTYISHDTSGKVIKVISKPSLGKSDTIFLGKHHVGSIRFDFEMEIKGLRGCVISEIEALGMAGVNDERFNQPLPIQLSASQTSLNSSAWQIQSAAFLIAKGEEISTDSFIPDNWIAAQVPGTILGSYYLFGALPDPLYGDNMYQISDRFFSGNDFWYRSQFVIRKGKENKRILLQFAGINWKADVYLNGNFCGRIDGAFQRATFDITAWITLDKPNTIAVKIHQVEYWETSAHKVSRKYLGARTTNGDNTGLSSPAFLSASGWNWLPIIRGRNTGIWNDVNIKFTEEVTISDSWVESRLPLPDTSRCELTLHTTVRNHTGLPTQVTIGWNLGNSHLSTNVLLNAYEEKEVSILPADYPQLQWSNPRLWWPNGYGKPDLYTASVKCSVNGIESDEQTFKFGIRQITYKTESGNLFLYCNGIRILVRGGNWGLPEAMLRCDEVGYHTRVQLHRMANLNMIRNWVGQTGHKAFYEACDSNGIMVWDDFWLANPVDGPDPKDNAMFMQNVKDKIKWVRKHACVVLYCGRNEGMPPFALDQAMQKATLELDGTRLYIPNSADGCVTGLGPYDMKPVAWYFENRGKTFHTEQGIVAFPEAESIRKMMPDRFHWPVNDMWAIHDYQWGRSDKFTLTLEKKYGIPNNLESYVRKAQLLNYETAKAMMECLQSNQGGGLLLWMSQSAWPSMICQLYDHYFNYTSAYFAIQKGASPVHVFWDAAKNEVKLSNNTVNPLSGVQVTIRLYNLQSKLLDSISVSGSAKPQSSATFAYNVVPSTNQVYFLVMQVMKDQKIISENYYWTEPSSGICTSLNDMPEATLEVKVEKDKPGRGKYSARIKNTGSQIALMTTLKLKQASSNEIIAPVVYSDNYFLLLPGQEKIIEMDIMHNTFINDAYLQVYSYNSKEIRIYQ